MGVVATFKGKVDEFEATNIFTKTFVLLVKIFFVFFFLYFFLVGLAILGDAFKVIAGDSAGSLFSAVDNPIAGLMVGILGTVLVQSSSTTTSVIVSAVGSNILSVTQAVPMIMGANIGTSVTNTIVSLGFAGDRENYRRAFSGATVHDMFNYLNVLILLPIEVIVDGISGKGGVLELLSKEFVRGFEENDDDKWVSPIKELTAKINKKVLSVDKDVIKDFSQGRPEQDLCSEAFLCASPCTLNFGKQANETDFLDEAATSGFRFFGKCGVPSGIPIDENTLTAPGCNGYVFSQKRKTCFDKSAKVFGGVSGLERCKSTDLKKSVFDICASSTEANTTVLEAAQVYFDDYKLVKAGVFFDNDVSDDAAGVISLILSLLILLICLGGIVTTLQWIIKDEAEIIIKRALNMNGYLAILVGAGITILVQSSSITTSTLTPLVAIGALELEKMYPLTLGANLGTTVTGFLAALASDGVNGFQIAICHLLFNIIGVLIWYPIPFMRAIPIKLARYLGDIAAKFRSFPLVYIFVLFIIYPFFFLGISVGIATGEAGGIAGAVIGILAFIAGHAFGVFWWTQKGGKEWFHDWVFSEKLANEEDQKMDTLA